MSKENREDNVTIEVQNEDGTPYLEDDGTPVAFDLTANEYALLVTSSEKNGNTVEEEMLKAIRRGVEQEEETDVA